MVYDQTIASSETQSNIFHDVSLFKSTSTITYIIIILCCCLGSFIFAFLFIFVVFRLKQSKRKRLTKLQSGIHHHHHHPFHPSSSMPDKSKLLSTSTSNCSSTSSSTPSTLFLSGVSQSQHQQLLLAHSMFGNGPSYYPMPPINTGTGLLSLNHLISSNEDSMNAVINLTKAVGSCLTSSGPTIASTIVSTIHHNGMTTATTIAPSMTSPNGKLPDYNDQVTNQLFNGAAFDQGIDRFISYFISKFKNGCLNHVSL